MCGILPIRTATVLRADGDQRIAPSHWHLDHYRLTYLHFSHGLVHIQQSDAGRYK